MSKVKILFVAALFAFISCEKDVDTPNWSQDPVFQIQGTLNGSPLLMQAGNDNYYLHTGFTDALAQPREFYGVLNNLNCPECEEQFQIRLRNHSLSMNIVSFDSIFAAGDHPFVEPYMPYQQGLYQYRFETELDPNQGAINTVFWDFGDGNTSTELNPVHVYEWLSGSPFRTCSLTVDYANGCQRSSSHIIQLGSNCFTSFTMQVSGNAVQFNLVELSSPSADYDWNFGDGLYSDQPEPYHVYSSPGVYIITLNVSDSANNCQSVYQRTVSVSSNECSVGFLYKPESLQTNSDSTQFRHMAVDFTDANGVEYSSEYGFQPAGTSISLTDPMEPYIINEAGNPTYRVNGSVNCYLYTADRSDSLHLENGSFSWAFAY